MVLIFSHQWDYLQNPFREHFLLRVPGGKEDTSHVKFRLMTLYGVIIQAS